MQNCIKKELAKENYNEQNQNGPSDENESAKNGIIRHFASTITAFHIHHLLILLYELSRKKKRPQEWPYLLFKN